MQNKSGDADHAPGQITMTNVKPDPDPTPLPREPRFRTPVPQKDLKVIERNFDQEIGAPTSNLLQELDSTLELAYAIEESLSQGETLKETLSSVSIGGNAVEHFDCPLQAILQQVLPIAQQLCKFSRRGAAGAVRLRLSCTSCTLDGVSKLRKRPHKVAMHHRDAKLEGTEACSHMRNLV